MRMGGVRVKEMVVVTLLTLLVVATTTLVHLSHLSRVVAQESQRYTTASRLPPR